MFIQGHSVMNGKYKIMGLLGEGAFGSVYKVEHETGGQFAMKVEQTDRCSQKKIKSAIFSEQAKIEKLRGLPYVPRTYDLGEVKSLDDKKYSLIIIDLLGKDLGSHFQNCGGQFPLQTVLHIGL